MWSLKFCVYLALLKDNRNKIHKRLKVRLDAVVMIITVDYTMHNYTMHLYSWVAAGLEDRKVILLLPMPELLPYVKIY